MPFIGIALAHGLAPRLTETLPVIQNELFHLGSDLCFTEEDKVKYRDPVDRSAARGASSKRSSMS